MRRSSPIIFILAAVLGLGWVCAEAEAAPLRHPIKLGVKCQKSFEKFLKWPAYYKTFAYVVGRRGYACAMNEGRRAALEACNRQNKGRCEVYAQSPVDGAVKILWRPRDPLPLKGDYGSSVREGHCYEGPDAATSRLFDYVRAGKSDVIVFYSGHGVPGQNDRKGYLLPVDADPNRAELNGYPLDTLLGNLAKVPARSMAVYLDACFSGESEKGTLVRATSGLTVQPRLPKSSTGMVVVTAAQNDQFASWDEDAKHGLFTKHLLEALRGKADGKEFGNGDGKVSLGELKSYLDEEMTYQARRRWSRDQNASVQGAGGVVLASYTPGQKAALVRPPSVNVVEVDATYVTLKTANIRARPSTAASRLGSIPAERAVTVTGRAAGGKWLRIERPDGGMGFIFAALLAPVNRDEIAAWNEVKDAKTAAEVTAFLRA